MTGPTDDEMALFVAMPERHLASLASLGKAPVVLPLGRPGDVERAPAGCPVYCVPLDDEGLAGPAATWAATLVGWTAPDPFSPTHEPEGLPPTWLDERRAAALADANQAPDGSTHGDDRRDGSGDHDASRQVFVSVEGLRSLDRQEWIFANEVVPKQQRGARSFVPMTPTLVRLPD